MHLRHLCALSLSLLLLLAACAPGSAPPATQPTQTPTPTPPPVAEQPTPPPASEQPPPPVEQPPPPPTPPAEEPVGLKLVRRTVYRFGPDNLGATEVELVPQVAEAVVGTGEVSLTWLLDREADGLKERIRSEGYAPASISAMDRRVQVRFAAGGPARWTVWLEGVEGSKTVLERRPEPRVQVGYRLGEGELVMIEGTEATLPPGQLTLEFRFDQPMAPDSLAPWWQLLGDWNRSHDLGSTAPRWAGPDHLVWELAQVPAKLELNVTRLEAAATGLRAVSHPLLIRSSETAPYLERLNLATGQRERLLAVVPEVGEARLSRDKGRVLLGFWEWQRRSSAWIYGEWAEVDLAQRSLTRLEGVPESWLERIHVATELWGSLSPSGEWVAGLLSPDPRELLPSDRPFARSLILVEQATGTHREYPNIVRGWPNKIGHFTFPAWSPDSTKVALLDMAGSNGPANLMLFDRVAEKGRIIHEALPLSQRAHRLIWSPDGARLLASGDGALTIIPVDGGKVERVEEVDFDAAHWDDRGERILAARGEWQGLFVYQVGSGERQELGDGWPVGWDGDWVYIIRWAGSQSRYIPPIP